MAAFRQGARVPSNDGDVKRTNRQQQFITSNCPACDMGYYSSFGCCTGLTLSLPECSTFVYYCWSRCRTLRRHQTIRKPVHLRSRHPSKRSSKRGFLISAQKRHLLGMLLRGAHKREKTEPHLLLERSKRKKNRSVLISVRIEKMAFFFQFFFLLVLVTPL